MVVVVAVVAVVVVVVLLALAPSIILSRRSLSSSSSAGRCITPGWYIESITGGARLSNSQGDDLHWGVTAPYEGLDVAKGGGEADSIAGGDGGITAISFNVRATTAGVAVLVFGDR